MLQPKTVLLDRFRAVNAYIKEDLKLVTSFLRNQKKQAISKTKEKEIMIITEISKRKIEGGRINENKS